MFSVNKGLSTWSTSSYGIQSIFLAASYQVKSISQGLVRRSGPPDPSSLQNGMPVGLNYCVRMDILRFTSNMGGNIIYLILRAQLMPAPWATSYSHATKILQSPFPEP